MPIYEYRCTDCGYQNEYLQKVSDPLLQSCPSCGREAFTKLLSVAGFQLKGSGWYATDFKGNGKKPAEKTSEEKPKEATGAAPVCGQGACAACTEPASN
ncbi:MAG: FmdB family transcriptional regulator [Betaproteobacteria bacterium RIFCSPLOWO2_02_FULL_66_14]|nr:MAG: FmdB family transcriptional regulator [Betaproteobacteria bacterium RIFCSPLOWO2_02_FULL_66_14]